LTALSTERWVTFDCYGTLVDWRSGMLEACAQLFPEHANKLLERYHEHEPRLEARHPFTTYREVLEDGLRAAAGDLGLDIGYEAAAILPDSIKRWEVFAEVPAVLTGLLQDGYRIGVLSNVDDDLIADTLPKLGVPIDIVVTAQQVRAYKPQDAHFAEFRRRAQPAPQGWTHVGCSYWHDIEPCARLGVPGVLVNRDRVSGSFDLAVSVIPDLRTLKETLTHAR
jgi:2-haloacid dehalogenase